MRAHTQRQINKTARSYTLITTWLGKRSCTRRELESLVGKLQQASAVVRPGRMFLRRLFVALRTLLLHHHYYRLSLEYKLDTAWWNELLTDWNGLSFFERPGWEPAPDTHISSNASGKLGYGVFHHNEWFNGRRLPAQETMCIVYKELFPIVLACAESVVRRKALSETLRNKYCFKHHNH